MPLRLRFLDGLVRCCEVPGFVFGGRVEELRIWALGFRGCVLEFRVWGVVSGLGA